MSQTVTQLDYHRNGISGLGFYVGIVQEKEDGEVRDMLVIRFPKEVDAETGNIVCAAFDLAQLSKKEIRFFYNSWRGDHYHDVMDRAIEERRAASEAEAEQIITEQKAKRKGIKP